MAEVKPSTSRGDDAAELVGEASCSGADGSTYPESIPPSIVPKSPSFFKRLWIRIQILTACSGLRGARGDGLLEPRGGLSPGPTTSGLASVAQRTQEDSESEVLSRISASKSTWSDVRGRDIHHSVRVPSPSELSVWEELKESAPDFFKDWDGEQLEVGPLIAEGGQAQIFEAKLKGLTFDLVLKVFKLDAGFSLADLKRHWPCSMRKGGELGCCGFRSGQERSSRFVFDDAKANIYGDRCLIQSATMLQDGRFAFIMWRYWGDLRTLIDLRVKENTHPMEIDSMSKNRGEQPPFSFANSICIMSQIAKGMQGLHAEGVLHRDLKAANVLIVNPKHDRIICFVADYECAMFVQGTGFWRAPEVLQELEKSNEDRNWNIWTEKVDVYSFGMTCYEILTGQIPFVGYTKSKWDDVIRGERPSLPDYVVCELQKLVEACWHVQPSQRPSFEVIIEKLASLQK